MKLYKQKASGYTQEVGEGINFLAILLGPFWFLIHSMAGKFMWSAIIIGLGTIMIGWPGIVILWPVSAINANRQYENFLIKKGYSVVHNKKEKKKEINKNFEWVCQYCKKEFETKEDAEKHEKNCVKKDSNWECEVCGKLFSTKEAAIKHEHKCKLKKEKSKNGKE